MTATYREILQQIRLSFPQPVSHRIHFQTGERHPGVFTVETTRAG